jgi:hypothetical protein
MANLKGIRVVLMLTMRAKAWRLGWRTSAMASQACQSSAEAPPHQAVQAAFTSDSA